MFSHETHRGQKQPSGRKRYPFPIQAFVTISCCASSKRAILKDRHIARASPTCMLPGIGDANWFRKFDPTQSSMQLVQLTRETPCWNITAVLYNSSVQTCGVLLRTIKALLSSRTNICRNVQVRIDSPPWENNPCFESRGGLRVRFTKRLQGRMRYYCSYNSRRVHFKISIPYGEERVCWT